MKRAWKQNLGFFLIVVTVSIFPFSAFADEYRVGPEDVLEVSFWQDPSLNTEVRVSLDGNITLDIIGSLEVAGKTTGELENEIVRKMSRFNQQISQAVVRVASFNFNHVYVTGQVNHGGKISFEQIPNLWTVINEAGGVSEFADLSRVTIIRGGEDEGKVEVVNVSQALATGQLGKLPKLRRQDTIEIPRNAASLPSGDLVKSPEKKNLIYVVGAVNAPGAIQFEENTDPLGALALAGGPSDDADLKKVMIVTKDGRYGQTMKINLEEYSEHGQPARYIMRREDTFVIPRKSGGLLGSTLATTAALLGTVSSILLIATR